MYRKHLEQFIRSLDEPQQEGISGSNPQAPPDADQEAIISDRKLISAAARLRFPTGFHQKLEQTIAGMLVSDTAEFTLIEQLFLTFKPLSLVVSLLILITAGYYFATIGFSWEALLGIPEYTIENMAYAMQ